MNNMLSTIFIGLFFGTIGTTVGGIIGCLLKNNSNKLLSFTLSFAAGLMMSVICFDLIPEALNLSSLKSAKSIKLPKEVGNLDLCSLESAEGLELPEKAIILFLNSLKSAKGLEFSEKVVYLNLSSLESAEGLELPDGIDMEQVYLPEEIKKELLAKQNSKRAR